VKLCILTSSYPQAANDPAATAGLFVKDFAEAVAAQGCDVTVLTQDRCLDEPAEESSNVRLVKYPWRGGNSRASYLRPYMPGDALKMVSLVRQGWLALERLHKEQRFDHVLAMWAAPAGYLARKLKQQCGVPYTAWCLGSDIWTYGRIPVFRSAIARVLQDADLLYADGEDLCRQAEKLGGKPCEFMPSSRRLDRSLAQPVPVIDREAGTRFFFVGRYAPVKGVDVLMEAMARFRQRGGKGHLYMFGGGPLEDDLRLRAAQTDLADCVTVGGFADEATVVSYLTACDCAVIPSRMESIPVALSDALQMERPVIVSDVGDMGQMVRDSSAGLVVPAKDVTKLCDAMFAIANRSQSDFRDGLAVLASKFDIGHAACEWLERVPLKQVGHPVESLV
jgi:glycosyltransferase involved in cell wall biosynthesis